MKKGIYVLSLAVGAVVVALGIYGYTLLLQRPDLPREIERKSVVKIEGTEIVQEKDIEFIFLKKAIGDSIHAVVERNGRQEAIEVDLIPYYYKSSFPFLYLVIGLFCLAIGMMVFILRPSGRKAKVYYWASLAFSYSIITNTGFILAKKGWFSHVPAILFYVLYPLAAALFLHFSFQFTPARWRISRILSAVIAYGPSFLLIGVIVTLYILFIQTNSIEIHRLFMKVLNVINLYLVLFVSFAIGHLIRLFRRVFLQEQKAQIKWALFGLTVGISPFLLLFLLPQGLGLKPIISEELSNVFFIIIPVAFFISIARYKLLKIELVINRSLVYGLLSIFTVGVYLFSVLFFQNLVVRWLSVNNVFLSGLAALVAASLFHPARKKIQEFVDKSFFRLSYDYKKNILAFMEQAQKIVDPEHLIDCFLNTIDSILPTEKSGIQILSIKSGPNRILHQRNWEGGLGRLSEDIFNTSLIHFKKSAVRTEEGIDFSQERFLVDNNIVALFPLQFQMVTLTGHLMLGEKKSGERYSLEDIELLQSLSRQFALNLERIRLQEEVFMEKTEKAKLDELSRLKTEFITSVSHEIRTPMSSIQGMTEMLTEGRLSDSSKRKELLKLIGNECARLSRYLHNILDFGKIETRTKKYIMQETDIRALVEDTLQLFGPRLESEGFVLKTDYPSQSVTLNIDRDAIKQALINLIDNAIKYSKEEKNIEVLLIIQEHELEIRVKDRGIGINEKEQKKIFKNFYRSKEAAPQFPSGAGLGLKIIKHIMDAHKGKIKISSQPGKGSAFSLIFKTT